MSDLSEHARLSVERQAQAFLKAEAARKTLDEAMDELHRAEERRFKAGEPLTAQVGDQAVTSWRTEGRGGKWHYVVSGLV